MVPSLENILLDIGFTGEFNETLVLSPLLIENFRLSHNLD